MEDQPESITDHVNDQQMTTALLVLPIPVLGLTRPENLCFTMTELGVACARK